MIEITFTMRQRRSFRKSDNLLIKRHQNCSTDRKGTNLKSSYYPFAIIILLSTCCCFIGVVESLHDEVNSSINSLTIVPPSKNRVYQRALGKSSIFTCYANVDIPERLTDFRWWWPDGRMIEPTDPKVEIMQDQPGSLTLLFTTLQEEDLGTYRCTANYANTLQLETDFTLRAYVPITFEDAPLNQFAIKGEDYKVKCRVKADPAPQIDWKKDHRMITNSDHYVMDKDGVVIRGVNSQDEGIYTCRVRVTSMGIIEEKHINVQVHEYPKILSQSETYEAVETGTLFLQCQAACKPECEYLWVNHRKQDLSMLERHAVDIYKGTLQIDGIKWDDAGDYTCTAKNSAGFAMVKFEIDVITKPIIEKFENITTQVTGNAEIVCIARGDPAPDILFHKDSHVTPFDVGPDRFDPRIFVDVRKDHDTGITVGTLKINDVLRNDDGLYNCSAYNKRIQTDIWGHITVEFPPTFINTPVREVWSWDGRPVNVTCLAEAIPNATISWYIEGALERPIDPYTPNIRQIGFESMSSLEIRPLDRYVYGFYKCIATNKLGVAEHLVQLREARRPGPILEAIVFERTATSLSYRIIGPIDDGGLPVVSFVAQYKEDRQPWEEHLVKHWPVDQHEFIIDGLEPMRTYYIRFAAENEVGLGYWAHERIETTPRRSFPEPPIILNEVQGFHGIAITAYPDRFELIWRVPQDNGERIEAFEISYVPVRNITYRRGTYMEYEWEQIGQRLEAEKPLGEPRHTLRNLAAETFYRVEIRARNIIGSSEPAYIIIRTAANPIGAGDAWRHLRSSPVKSASISYTLELTRPGIFLCLSSIYLIFSFCNRLMQ